MEAWPCLQANTGLSTAIQLWDQALHPCSCPSAVPHKGLLSSCCHRSTDKKGKSKDERADGKPGGWEEPRWFRASPRMKQPSAGAAESQGQRLPAREHPCSGGCFAGVRLPAAVLSPEGLGKQSLGLEEESELQTAQGLGTGGGWHQLHARDGAAEPQLQDRSGSQVGPLLKIAPERTCPSIMRNKGPLLHLGMLPAPLNFTGASCLSSYPWLGTWAGGTPKKGVQGARGPSSQALAALPPPATGTLSPSPGWHPGRRRSLLSPLSPKSQLPKCHWFGRNWSW